VGGKAEGGPDAFTPVAPRWLCALACARQVPGSHASEGDKGGLTKRNVLSSGPSGSRVRLMVCWRDWQRAIGDSTNGG
jgi:hypothetical protein